MTTERPITLQEYAMRFGTYMGLFWIFKFIFLPIGFSIPLLQLLFILMTLFVPVLGYIYARRYRNQYHEGNFSFTQAFSFCFLMYLFASILTALAHYVYFRFIDQGYLLNTYLDQLETIKDSVTGDMKISVEQLIGSLNVISSHFFATDLSAAFAEFLLWNPVSHSHRSGSHEKEKLIALAI